MCSSLLSLVRSGHAPPWKKSERSLVRGVGRRNSHFSWPTEEPVQGMYMRYLDVLIYSTWLII